MNFFKTSKKSLGQNFLIDQNIINKIIKIGNIGENKTVFLSLFPNALDSLSYIHYFF